MQKSRNLINKISIDNNNHVQDMFFVFKVKVEKKRGKKKQHKNKHLVLLLT